LINGKFLTGPGMTGSIDSTFQVINELAAQEMQAKIPATVTNSIPNP